MTNPVRVAIFDGYALFRRGVVDVLRGTNLLVVAEDETLESASELIAKCEPDIVLFDIQAPGADIETIAGLLQSFPRSRFVILTASDEKVYIEQVWSLGVHGCVIKGVGASELIRALEGVHNGQPYMSATLAAALLKKEVLAKPVPPREELVGLTTRDRQILAHLADGLTNQQIAQHLGLTVKAVKRHLSGVFRKLRVRNRLQAALHARKHAKELGI
jgi:two-component system, NarL family, nitrate/nitrite response regulator NarL